ncbi:serine/threonine-protein kinase ATM [Lactuca sativa]|uniref:PWWP domain-containing protein n=1 Tax=Lactuca sativa TaxID=4236 RepID=A0A9R1VHG4_LACSA|nr:serine/threonine-protein kinase ATM [Lactuca sativa]XP_052620111.1 serine/threonine-protein kinase ATM [Lactuca sativa]KAJ0207307.1 hypothetical protein LSAT_V11C500234580 [Lactuca sativa]
METFNTSETLIEGLVSSKQDGNVNLMEETAKSFDIGEENRDEPVSTSVAENGSGVDLSSHADVPMKGISLFVELTGDISHHLEEHRSSKRNQGEVTAAYKQCGVSVGDLVWAMIKKQSWWPGIVCEASSVQVRENGLLIRCFGNGNYIWCRPNELKPFIEHFQRFSNQRNSKNFFGAMDKALAEVGQRVKTEFTCSCFSNVVMKRRGNVDDLSLTRFEPVKFLEYIEDLSRNVCMPNKVDFSINMNFLSAFNHSLGHCQIPVHQLKPSWSPSKIKTEDENGFLIMEDDTEGSGGKSEKGYETRERRKSRFLSYPGEQRKEELKEDDNGGMELNKTNELPSKKKPRKKYTKKLVMKEDPLPVNICPSDVLSVLQSAAQDCGFPSESDKFDSVKRFVAGFRKWVFSDSTNGITTGIKTPESEKPKKVRKKKKQSGSLILDFQNANPVLVPQSMANQGVQNNTIYNFKDPQMTKPPLRKLLPKRSLNNMDNNTPIQAWNSNPTPLPNVNGHMNMNMNTNMNMNPYVFPSMEESNQAMYGFGSTQPWLINHGQPQVSKVNHEPKKRGRKRKHVEFQANDGLIVTPDLTKNGGEKKKGKRGKKKEETGVPCIDLSYNKVNQENTQVTGTAFLLKFSSNYPLPSTQVLNLVFSKYGELNESETFISTENLSGQVVFSDSSSAGGAFWGLQNDQPFGPALVNYRIQHLNNTDPIEFKTPIKSPVLSQGGQEGKFDTPGVIGPYMIPDLNGYANETKTKKMEEIRLPSMDLSYGNEASSGTALLLKFSPHHPLPSQQDLNLVFCKYGLNGSETRVMGQDLTGQVVFVNPLIVGEAVQKLEKERPFGESLVSYRVQHLYSVKPAIPLGIKKPVHVQQEGNNGNDLGVIRKNLEMMRVMLEKAGGGLSPEMRGKLESEIRGLMNKIKVSGMDGCSSSSL